MAVLSKPVHKMVIIKKEASQQFIHEFNKNQVTKEFMDSCKKAGELFERTKSKNALMGRDNLTQVEFDTMMGTGLSQAKSDDAILLYDAFNYLKNSK